MFNLEQSIAQWRRQMLATGISALELDELEIHMREEVARQMQLGIKEQEAFETAVSQIGKGAELKREFAKIKGLFGLLGDDKFTRTNRILGTLWLVFCSASLILLFRVSTVKFIAGPLMLAIYGTGLYGSILLIRGAPMGRRIIRTIAGGFVMISLFLCFTEFQRWHVTSTVFTSFYTVTAWLLFRPSNSNADPARI